MTLTTSLRRYKDFTRRILATTILSEKSLPYDIQIIDTPERVHDFWTTIVAAEPDHEADKENVVVAVVNTRFKPYAWNRVSIGTVNEATVHPREMLRPVIAAGGYGFIVMHNHPSGDPSPSRADESVTRRLRDAAEILQIRFFDHIIIGTTAPSRLPYFSFREAGLI
jgi:DNA repair protein RadC